MDLVRALRARWGCIVCTLLAPALLTAQTTWDFETGSLSGWTSTGNAFWYQPTYGNNIAARAPGIDIGIQGSYWIGTFERRPLLSDPLGSTQGDGPIGTLSSSSLSLTRPYLTFLIGGGNDWVRLRVEVLLKMLPGEEIPAILYFLGLGERVAYPDGDYFVAAGATGRNSDVMRRETIDFTAFLGRAARVRIKDLSSYGWGHINVDDIRFSDQRPRTTFAAVDEGGVPISGADLFVNGVLAGTTDGTGTVTIDPSPIAGTQIVIRKRVHENQTYRDRHSLGSTRNWNYRVYISNLRVNPDGTTSALTLDGTTRNYTVRLSRNNTLVGFHWIVSGEYDMSAPQMFAIQEEIRASSQWLYNASDGQFFVEQVEFRDNKQDWDYCDFKVHANRSLRANAWKGGFLFNHVFLGHTAINMNPLNWSYVWAHEFGHSGFDMDDEYDDNNSNTVCTSLILGTDPRFGIRRDSAGMWLGANPLAACLMWNTMPKFCSTRPENPHALGTRQGGDSCWTTLVARYRDTASPARWSIVPPTSRGFTSTLVPLISGFQPRFQTENAVRADLVSEFDLWLVNSAGTPLPNEEIFVETTYGQRFLVGRTSADDTRTILNEAGKITVHGAHIGDRVTAGGGANYVVPPGAVIAHNFDVGHDIALRGPSAQQGPQVQLIRPDGPQARIEVKPLVWGEVGVTVLAPTDAQTIPTAEYTVDDKWHSVLLTPLGNNRYEGKITGLPKNYRATMRVAVSDQQGERDWIYQFLGSGANIKQKYMIPSIGGDLTLRAVPGCTAANAPIVIGPAVDSPTLPKEMVLLAGPFQVDSPEPLLKALPGNFHLERKTPVVDGAPAEFDHFVLLFDEQKATWYELPRKWLPEPLNIVTFKLPRFGTVALVGRRK